MDVPLGDPPTETWREKEELLEMYLRRRSIANPRIDWSDGWTPDPIDRSTIARVKMKTVLEMARWSWNRKSIYQGFTGVCGIKPVANYPLLQPLSQPRKALPNIHINPVMRSWYEVGLVPRELFVPRTDPRGERALCGLFPVPKDEEEKKGRIVFDARPGNAWFDPKDVAPLLLFTLFTLLRALSLFITGSDPCHFLSGDFRHYYYQLKMPLYYAVFMAVVFSDNCRLLPAVMAMGFFAVCTWAQTTTLTMILHVKPNEPFLGVAEEEVCENMPRIIWLHSGRKATLAQSLPPSTSHDDSTGGKQKKSSTPPSDEPSPKIKIPDVAKGDIIGFIVVLMDGFLLVTRDGELKQQWSTRLQRNFKLANVELKPNQAEKECRKREPQPNLPKKRRKQDYAETFFETSCERAEFAGIEIEVGKGWRPLSSLSPYPEVGSRVTKRYWAGILGEMLWSTRVATKPLINQEALLDAYHAIHTHGDLSWDHEIEIDEKLHLALREEYDVCSERNWVAPLQEMPVTQWYLAASDAHPKGRGWVFFKLNHGIPEYIQEAYVPTEKQGQVAQEVAANVDVCEAIMLHAKWEGHDFAASRIGIVEALDANSARFALEKEYSGSPELRPHIRRRLEQVPNARVAHHYCRVPGVDLVADFPSRGLYVYQPEKNAEGAVASYKHYASIRTDEDLWREVERRKEATVNTLLDSYNSCVV